MLWIILAIIATLLWTGNSLLDKFVINKELKDPLLATLISGFATFLLFILIGLIKGVILLPIKLIIIAIIAGILYNLALWLYYVALKKEEVSRFIPILYTTPIFVAILGFIFLNEKFSTLTYLGIILIVIGAILISIKKTTKKTKISSALMVGIGSALFFAIRDILTKTATLSITIWPVIFWIGIGGGIFCITFFAFHHPHLREKAKLGTKHLIIVGSTSAIAFLLFTIAISIKEVSLVSALISTEALFIFLFASIISKFYPKIMKEKITKQILIQKLIAIIIIIIGAILII